MSDRTSSKPSKPATAASPGGHCEFTFSVQNVQTLNINCAPGQPTQPEVPETPQPPQPQCPQTAPGACIPHALGSKPKQGLQAKLQRLVQGNPAASVLAATIFHQARRFLSGRTPGNALEASVFEVLGGLSPTLKGALACALGTLDGLPKNQRDHLFEPDAFVDPARALDPDEIADLLVRELEARTANEIFDDPTCTEQRPGLPRPVFSIINGGAFLGFLPRICRINGLRTIFFDPALSIGDYRPDELQQICTPEVTNGEVQLNCQVQTAGCPGHQLGGDGPCLRVPAINAGDTVVLEGVNFFNVDAKVRLRAKPPGTAVVEVETFVCGDEETPATEPINGQDVVINDCRVRDRLTFRVPEDLPVGIYEVRVAVPNDTGVPNTDPEFVSGEVHIEVVPPDTARFQIASEQLRAEKETSPASFGSDEVAIRFLAVPIFAATTDLEMQAPIDFRFGDVDSGDVRDMSRVLVQGTGLAGVSIALVGYEVDSESAFEQQIDSFTEAFVDIIERIWNAIKEKVGAGVAGIIEKFGTKGAIAVAIAAAIVLAVVVIVALWAPADLIIEDTIALSVNELAALTSANFPAPAERQLTTNGGIDVRVVPVSKDVQYRERREYRSDDEDSEYHITLRYNRLA